MDELTENIIETKPKSDALVISITENLDTSSPTLARAEKKEILRAGFINEIADYVVANGGPDDEGRAHHTAKRIDVNFLKPALNKAYDMGLAKEWRPYHFVGHNGTYKHEHFVAEVLKKKCEQLLNQNFGGDLFRFVTEATTEDLRSPLIDSVAGRKVTVSMGAVGQSFGNSPYKMIKEYLEITKDSVFKDIRPYHMLRASSGTYEDKAIINEVLKKKCEQLLNQNFGGDIFRFVTEVTKEDLISPLIDKVAGRKVTVSMGSVGNSFGNSSYKMIKEYLEITKDSVFKDIRPYHMLRASSGTYEDKAIINEVLKKKCEQLLNQNFGGDLFRFVTEATTEDLRSPLIDSVAGRKVTVSMGAVGQSFGNSSYKMIKEYLEITKDSEFKDMRPYHMQFASRGTYKDKAIINEVLKKKCEQLLNQNFGGDLFSFVTEVTQEDLISPLIDKVAGRKVTVSMARVGNSFGNSSYKMIKEYLEITKDSVFKDLRPYHMQIASMGTYKDKAIINEVLKKKCEQLLNQNFGGDIFRFLTEVTQEDLISPLIDSVAGRDVTVSMAQVGHSFGGSPYKMIKEYLEITKDSVFKDLRPYHMLRASQGTYKDKAIINEVLKKKCEQLLNKNFGGDLFRFVTEVTQEDLLSPLIDSVAGREVTVSMGAVGNSFGGSPYEMIKRYYKITGREVEFSKECLLGSPETRARRLRGEFNSRDLKLIRTDSGDFDTSRFGLRVFNSEEKGISRELVIGAAAAIFGDQTIRYLGLEDQNMESLRLIRENLNLSPRSSVIVERDPRVFAAMNALRRKFPNGEGRDLAKVSLIQGELKDVVPTLEQKFNLANFDFVGHLSQSSLDAVSALLNGHLESESLLAVTLQDTEIAASRTKLAGLGEDGWRAFEGHLRAMAEAQYEVHPLSEIRYSGGTGRRDTPMVTLVFRLKSK